MAIMLVRFGAPTRRDRNYLQIDSQCTYRFGVYPGRGQVALLVDEFRTWSDNLARGLAVTTGFNLHIFCSRERITLCSQIHPGGINTAMWETRYFLSRLPQLLFGWSMISESMPTIEGECARKRNRCWQYWSGQRPIGVAGIGSACPASKLRPTRL